MSHQAWVTQAKLYDNDRSLLKVIKTNIEECVIECCELIEQEVVHNRWRSAIKLWFVRDACCSYQSSHEMHNYPKWITAECVLFLFGLPAKRRSGRVTVINGGCRLVAKNKLVLLTLWRLRIVDWTIQFCGAFCLLTLEDELQSQRKLCNW